MESIQVAILNDHNNRDDQLKDIEQRIHTNQKLLFKKKREIEAKCNTNDFLKTVASDYANYNNYLIEEKQTQYDSLQQLQTYLTNLKNENAKLDAKIYNSENDEEEILKEMEKLRRQLNKLIDNSRPLNSIKG